MVPRRHVFVCLKVVRRRLCGHTTQHPQEKQKNRDISFHLNPPRTLEILDTKRYRSSLTVRAIRA